MTRRSVVAGAAVLVAFGVGAAHATALPVSTAPMTARTVSGCSSATLAIAESPTGLINAILGYTAVSLTVPAACAGADLSLTIHATGGTDVQATATASDVAAGPITLATSATYGGWFRPAYSVAVTMDGWSIPASF